MPQKTLGKRHGCHSKDRTDKYMGKTKTKTQTDKDKNVGE